MTEEAWHELLSEHARVHGRRYVQVAQRILRNAAAAEDACQTALTKAWQHRDSLRDQRGLNAWLIRVVVNESFQRLRREKTERRVLAQHVTVAAEGRPDQAMEQRDTVLHALAELDEMTRTVVVLRVMHGFSGNEVKDMLGCSASEVSRRLHAGMNQLRAQEGARGQGV